MPNITDEQLLAILKIPTQEGQIKRLIELGYTDLFVERKCGRDGTTYEVRQGSLEGLAFRLRDEAYTIDGGVWFGRGIYKIIYKVEGHDFSLNEYLAWSTLKAKPIDWVIAALMAKEHAKE